LLGPVASQPLCSCHDDAAQAAGGRKGTTMNTNRIIAGALLSAALTVAGMGLATGTAQADPQSTGPFQWCPGQPLPGYPRGAHVVWDNSVCHTYWKLTVARGNVPMSDGGNNDKDIWDGPDPPPYFEPVCAPFVPPVNCRPN
jgi:hypothetical protein